MLEINISKIVTRVAKGARGTTGATAQRAIQERNVSAVEVNVSRAVTEW